MRMMTPLTQATDALWSQGWYRFAAHQRSPNFGPRQPQTLIDLIVLHSISLPPGQYGGPEVLQFFNNQLDWKAHPYFSRIQDMKVSAHFFIRRNGELWQLVSCNDRAWHAGASNYRGRDNCNDDSIGIELEGLEGDLFEDAQYECLQSVCAALIQRYPIEHLAGHEHIAPGRKGDPGAGFDWLRLQNDLALDARYLPVAAPPEAASKNCRIDLIKR
jgi:AmpD protein